MLQQACSHQLNITKRNRGLLDICPEDRAANTLEGLNALKVAMLGE